MSISDPSIPANGIAAGESLRDAALSLLATTRPAIHRRLADAAAAVEWLAANPEYPDPKTS